MAYIKFARNQSNEAAEMLVPIDNIVTMNSSGATNLVIKTGTISNFAASATAEIVTFTLQVAATGGATLTRPNIVQKVIDTIEKAGLSGGAPTVPDMEVQLLTISGETF